MKHGREDYDKMQGPYDVPGTKRDLALSAHRQAQKMEDWYNDLVEAGLAKPADL